MHKQNQFYSSISKYYSEIFPYKPIQLKFVQNCIGDLHKKQILDIGCATGDLAFNLAKNSAIVTGIDLNEDLLKQAKKLNSHVNLSFKTGNMLELQKDFKTAKFDSVLCFGNTMVHLQTKKLVEKMLEGVYNVLNTGGKFLIQILNYDFIMSEQISELPIIETDKIKFIRNYKFANENTIIQFKTDLLFKKENKTVSNETPLLPLKSTQLVQLLIKSGFLNIELFSSFKKDEFGERSLPLVLSCSK